MGTAHSEARVFEIRLGWASCDGVKIIAEDLRRLRRVATVEVRESSLTIASHQLEKTIRLAQTILKKLEEAGCNPIFQLSTRIPEEPVVVAAKPQSKKRPRTSSRLATYRSKPSRPTQDRKHNNRSKLNRKL